MPDVLWICNIIVTGGVVLSALGEFRMDLSDREGKGRLPAQEADRA